VSVRSLLVLFALLTASSAHAQSEPPLGRVQLGGGVGFISGASLGDADANLRASGGGEPFRVFSTSSRLSGTTVLDLRAGVDLTRRFGLEAHALYGHPELRTRITDDVEDAPAVTAVERLDHYLIDGGVIVMLDELRVKGWQPFAAAGAGYLRQLHEGLTLTEEGHLFYVGGGARRMLAQRPRGFPRGLGARGDVRVNLLFDGVTVEDNVRRHVAVSGGIFVVF
jgi:hypothetical protein